MIKEKKNNGTDLDLEVDILLVHPEVVDGIQEVHTLIPVVLPWTSLSISSYLVG